MALSEYQGSHHRGSVGLGWDSHEEAWDRGGSPRQQMATQAAHRTMPGAKEQERPPAGGPGCTVSIPGSAIRHALWSLLPDKISLEQSLVPTPTPTPS